MVCCIRYCYKFCISYYGRIGRFVMKIICDKCKGNGYLRLRGYDLEEAILQCDKCNSQGEIDDEPILLPDLIQEKADYLIPPKYQLTYQPILNPIFFG